MLACLRTFRNSALFTKKLKELQMYSEKIPKFHFEIFIGMLLPCVALHVLSVFTYLNVSSTLTHEN